MERSQYCVLWNNYHGTLASTLCSFRKDGMLVDASIVCADGNKVRAHQLVLAACSTYFKNFLKDYPTKHPIILLPGDIHHRELKAIIEFIYTGQVCISQEQLHAFIRSAKYLKIKGLEEDGDSDAEEVEVIQDDENPTEMLEGEIESKSLEPAVSLNLNKEKDFLTAQTELADSDDPGDRWEEVDRKPIIMSTHKNSEQISGMTDFDICTCAAPKVWSVKDIEALLKAWNETLSQVPPSYFIRSMSLCKQVAKRLQTRGIQKSWRQCQVKMKNLRREVRLYKSSGNKKNPRKPSEVAVACGKFLNEIEQIFNKEKDIRKTWYQMRSEERNNSRPNLTSDRIIFTKVTALGDSDFCEEDTDGQGLETEGECSTFEEHDNELHNSNDQIVHIVENVAKK